MTSAAGSTFTFEAATSWLSAKAEAIARDVEVAATSARESALQFQNQFATTSFAEPQCAEEKPLDEFEWLPPRDREAMLSLRWRAETKACDAADDALEVGLRRLRGWAERAQWCTDHWPDGEERPAQWGDVSPRWKRLGFQSADPRRDMRTGILALDNLVYFFELYPTEAERLCAESARDGLDYPLAVASINITQMIAWYLSLVPGANPAGPGSSATRLDDMMQIHAFARLSAAHGELNAFGELHSSAMLRFHQVWAEMRAADPNLTLSSIGDALHATLAVVDAVIRESPLETLADLRNVRGARVPAM